MIQVNSIVVGKCPQCGAVNAGQVVTDNKPATAEGIGHMVLCGLTIEVLPPDTRVKISGCKCGEA